MKILYFDTFSLFYSQHYIRNDNDALIAYKEWRDSPHDNLLKVVRPDIKGIETLRGAAIESGFKLYPLGTRYTRAAFIENGLMSEGDLAPDRVLKLRIGDSDPIRRMIAHSQHLNAKWYVCGDIGSEYSHTVRSRHLTSAFGYGVTDELIIKVGALKSV